MYCVVQRAKNPIVSQCAGRLATSNTMTVESSLLEKTRLPSLPESRVKFGDHEIEAHGGNGLTADQGNTKSITSKISRPHLPANDKIQNVALVTHALEKLLPTARIPHADGAIQRARIQHRQLGVPHNLHNAVLRKPLIRAAEKSWKRLLHGPQAPISPPTYVVGASVKMQLARHIVDAHSLVEAGAGQQSG